MNKSRNFNTLEIEVKSFQAVKNPDICEQIQRSHIERLKDFKIYNLPSNNEEWMYDNLVYCVFIQDKISKKILGSLRLHIFDKKHKSFTEEILINLGGSFNDLTNNRYLLNEMCEFKGLWCSDNSIFHEYYLPSILVSTMIAISYPLKIKYCLAISSHSILEKVLKEIGFSVHEYFNKPFPYPDDRYKSWVSYLELDKLMPTKKGVKEFIIKARNEIVFDEIYFNGNNKVIMHYNLNL